MRSESSVFPDLVRFCAALVVAFDHLGDYTNGLLWQFGAFGAPAVDVFFVLSGYVIALTVTNRERNLSQYAISRCARLYSVVLPTLIISFVLGIAGTVLRPAVEWGDTSLVAYLRCLLFTNELWFSNVTPGYNGPFWSLGYEVWYYIIFAAAYFGKGVWRAALTVLFVAVAGPRIMMMFPLWLVGVAAWMLPGCVSIGKFSARLIWWGSAALLSALVLWQLARISDTHSAPDIEYAAGRTLAHWRAFFVDYGIGVLVALNFLSFNLSAEYCTGLLNKLKTPVRWLSGATFTLYLLHVPVAQFLVATSPWQVGTLPQRILVIGGTFSVVFVVAQYTERRKAVWRDAISKTFALQKCKRIVTER